MRNSEIKQHAKPCTRRRPGRPTTAQAYARDNALLDTGRNLFIRYGFQHVSIAMIAQTAGVAARTIYTRFGGKRGLLASVIEREREQRLARLERLVESGASLDKCLVGVAEDMLEDVLFPHLRQLQCDVVAERDPGLVLRLQPGFRRRWILALARIFDRDEWKARCSLGCGTSIVVALFIGCVLAEHLHELPGEPVDAQMRPKLAQLARIKADRFLLVATGGSRSVDASRMPASCEPPQLAPVIS